MPPNPPSNAHGFAMRSMSLRDMQIPKSEKKISCPPPPKSWGRPCNNLGLSNEYLNDVYDCVVSDMVCKPVGRIVENCMTNGLG